MNIKNITRLMDFIRVLPHVSVHEQNPDYDSFDMGLHNYPKTKRPACIIGWARHFALRDGILDLYGDPDVYAWLGLGGVQIHNLAYPFLVGTGIESLWEIEPEQAASVLQHLLDTGEVDWSILSSK